MFLSRVTRVEVLKNENKMADLQCRIVTPLKRHFATKCMCAYTSIVLFVDHMRGSTIINVEVEQYKESVTLSNIHVQLLHAKYIVP